ncbi:MAG: hypothetical protein L0K86_20670, partial [Actinomycetia bacterium]|nr:hypothetical protein [Actinomycetes bacterium]
MSPKTCQRIVRTKRAVVRGLVGRPGDTAAPYPLDPTHRGLRKHATEGLNMGTTDIAVVKRDGSRVPYDGYEIAESIREASDGLDDAVARATQIQSELE